MILSGPCSAQPGALPAATRADMAGGPWSLHEKSPLYEGPGWTANTGKGERGNGFLTFRIHWGLSPRRSHYFGTFSQSFRNRSMPASVRGCFESCSRTLNGMVAICAPRVALSRTWSGFLTLATITSVGNP